MMTVRANNDLVVPDHEALIMKADDALGALAASTDRWLEQFAHAKRDLGVPLFATSDDAEG